jgi:hypothetical protein
MKITAILMVILLTSIFTYAQDHKFETGILGGANQIIPAYSTLHSYAFGVSYGASFQYNLVKRFSLKANIIYQEYIEHFRYEGVYGWHTGVIYPGVDIDSKTNSIMIPVLAQWTFGEKTKVFFNVGPQFNMVYKLKYDYRYDTGVQKENTFNTKNFDMELVAGIGLSYPISNQWSLYTEGRFVSIYENSLTTFYGVQANLFFGITYGFGAK